MGEHRMLNWMGPWPFANSGRDDETAAVPWSLESTLEAQTRLWNHMLDANRSLWMFYAPWLQAAPWWGDNPMAPADADEPGLEPAETADGLPDALESQARTWNHFMDAQRTFWSALNFEVPGLPWTAAAVIAKRTFDPEPRSVAAERPTSNERHAAKRNRPAAPTKSRAAKSR